MKRLLKIVLIMILLMAATPTFLALGYYAVGFLSYHDEIVAKIENSDPAHKVPPIDAYKLTVIFETHAGIRRKVAGDLLRDFGLANRRMLYWHFNYAAWSLLLPLHFDENQIYTLWCEMLTDGNVIGFSAVSEAFYGKSLAELTPEEMARIIVYSRSPTYYEKNRDRLEARVKLLLNLLDT